MAQFSLKGEEAELEFLKGPVTPYEDSRSSPGDIMETSPLPIVGRRTMVRSVSMFEPEGRTSNTMPSQSRVNRQRPALVSRREFSTISVPAIPERSYFQALTQSDKENDGLADQFEESPRKTPRKFFSLGIGRKIQEAFSPCQEDSLERSPLQPVSANTSFKRRLPQFRRTQSMVTKNDDFLAAGLAGQQTPASCHHSQRGDMMSPISPEQLVKDCHILPSFDSRADQLRRITGETFVQVLEGIYKHAYDKLEVIDCRFPHEFAGGHIPNATNISSLDAMDNHPLLTQPQAIRTLIVLHCEYSAHRAPRIALHLRSRDRILNAHRYPKLFYPEVYILDGGYSNFFKKHRHHVGGMGYVEMNDPTHKPFASKQMHNFRKNTKFQRTQSYTFGQSCSTVGGESMLREENFRLSGQSSANQSIVCRLAPPNDDTFLQPSSLGKDAHSGPSVRDESGDDSFGDSSMMDVDDESVNSPLPCYANTATNNFQRSHTRTSSGRIDPRRLSSF